MSDSAGTSQTPTRWIQLEGCLNFRDIGGYRTRDGRVVRWGRLYRADKLNRLSENDVAVVSRHLGIRTVIDLRRPHEVGDPAAAPLAEVEGLTYHNVSLNRAEIDGAEPAPVPVAGLGEVYLWIAERVRDAVCRIIDILSTPDAYPAVFHCMGGKDRTGMIAAFILEVLGVSDSDIVEDYALSERIHRAQSEEALQAAFTYVRERELSEEVLFARPESMVEFLRLIRARYGSIRGYLTGCRVPEDRIEELRDYLTLPAADGGSDSTTATPGQRPDTSTDHF